MFCTIKFFFTCCSTLGSGSSGSVESRVLATLLTEMDGIDGAGHGHGVIVLGATNRLHAIDAALLRKGRFHHLLYIPPPDKLERKDLLHYFCKKCFLFDEDIGSSENDSNRLIEELEQELKEGMSGADIENLCREKAMWKFGETLIKQKTIK